VLKRFTDDELQLQVTRRPKFRVSDLPNVNSTGCPGGLIFACLGEWGQATEKKLRCQSTIGIQRSTEKIFETRYNMVHLELI